MLTAEVTLPGMTASVPTARRFVESVLTGWGLPDLGWTAAMLTSELATNCALHAGTAFRVRVLRTGEATVRLEVTDSSLRLPQQRQHSSTSTTGRGLRIIGELSSAWGVQSTADGKTVWAELVEATAEDTGPADADDADVDLDLDRLLNGFRDDDGPVDLAARRPPATGAARRAGLAAAA